MSNIFSLSEAASIAIHATIIIARSKEPTNVVMIAEAMGSSKHHVAKILQRLVKDNFLLSYRGPTGGFLLKKKPAEISFLNLYESVEGKYNIPDCPLDKQVCPFDKCIMNNVAKTITNEFLVFLKTQTIEKYLK